MYELIKKILRKVLPECVYNVLRRLVKASVKFILLRIFYPLLYAWCARKPVNPKKVLFVEVDFNKLSDNFRLIWDRLESGYDYELELFLLEKFKPSGKIALFKRFCRLIEQASGAKYIFLNEALPEFGNLPFRKETRIYNTWHACGAFKRFGFAATGFIFGGNRRRQEMYPHYKFCNAIFVSSPEVVGIYADSMGVPEDRVIPLGVSRTDIFFDEEFRAAARKKFELFFPGAKGKKTILYAPTFRGHVKGAEAPGAFSIPMFYDALSQDCVLVIKHHPYVKKRPSIPDKYRNFAVDFTGIMSIEELLCVADFCITDYSSLVFEYSLFEKPMLFFAYDRSNYDDWRGFYYDYSEFTPGPVCTKNSEMIDYIRNADRLFDRKRVADFREKFMSSCDGHATERVLEHVFGKDLEEHAVSKDLSDGRRKDAIEVNPDFGMLKNALLSHSFGNDGEPVDSEERIADFRSRLEEKYPMLAGKKIVAYLMKDTPVESYPVAYPFLDWIEFYEALSDDIAVVYCHSGERKDFKPSFESDVFFMLPEDMDKDGLLLVADAVVTDYDTDAVKYDKGGNVFLFIPEFRWLCSDEEQYENSTAELREKGVFFESSEELALALNRALSESD